jgi:DNA-binding NarL/FixJ family response regulator
MIRVLLVDDHPIVRDGYARLLMQDGDMVVVANAASAEEGYAAFIDHAPDVTVSDMAMGGAGGLELLRKIKQRDAQAKVLLCSMYDSDSVVRAALEGGAMGFVTKTSPPENLCHAVRAAFAGQRYLSEDLSPQLMQSHPNEEAERIAQLSLRELEIWRLLAMGRSHTECAQLLNLSLKTVANNQTQIKEKLAVSNTAALVHLAQRHQLIAAPTL